MTRLSSVAAVAAAAALANQVYFASAQDYEYLGCFHDEDGDRVLGDKIWSSDMTTEVSPFFSLLGTMHTESQRVGRGRRRLRVSL